jgi:hypothetical protein
LIAALLVASALAQTASPQPGTDPSPADERALAVLERTKTTRATYALYGWNWIQDRDGSLREGWSAEFNSGTRHRVETPEVRVVADCDTQTGTALNVTTGERFSGRQVAQAACGISTARPIFEVTWLGAGPSRFGPVDRLHIADEADERFYVVDPDGILVGAEIYGVTEPWCLRMEALAVERRLPEGDIFSEQSLDRSVVPRRYTFTPNRYEGDLWTPGRNCPLMSPDTAD